MTVSSEDRLGEYFDHIGRALGRKGRREAFAVYARGILSDAERKTIEPIVTRACTEPARFRAEHQRLLHFALDAPWSDRDVRLVAARYALDAMTARCPVESWTIDDTTFMKQGSHSVGVERQYTNSVGKIRNCQIGVSLTVTTRAQQVPIDFALYLPESWARDPTRRQEARIPDDVQFATKVELALQLLARAVDAGIPRGLVLADRAYGDVCEFRRGIRKLGLHYALDMDHDTAVVELDALNRPIGHVTSISALVHRLEPQRGIQPGARYHDPRSELSTRFAVRRVAPVADLIDGCDREPVWLAVARTGDEPACCLVYSVPERMEAEELARIAMQRACPQRTHRVLKHELGLDHYEGRRFPGWHHHVSVVLCCYAFMVAERARHSRLTESGSRVNNAPSPASRASLH
jgi:SRSO17 transposase